MHLPRHTVYTSDHGEKLLSAGGGFFGILAVLLVSSQFLDLHGAALITASIGASAVLLFAVPHGELSQPWPLVGGHLISASIGVTCAQHIGDPYLAAALAVASSIAAMYYLRCLHPPGGATALVAVVGGTQIQALGYGFLVAPVLVNILAILAVAVLVNLPFAWRRYPLRLARPRAGHQHTKHEEKCLINHSDLVYALSEINSFIDVSEQDLLRIYRLATRHAHWQPPAK